MSTKKQRTPTDAQIAALVSHPRTEKYWTTIDAAILAACEHLSIGPDGKVKT
jgi:hypothetical protein